MAAEAKHVRPGGQAQVLELGKLAETEACGDAMASVVADGQVGEPVGGSDAAVERPGAFSGIGSVLGHVASDLGVGHVAAGGHRADIELPSPGQRAGREIRCGGSRDADGADGLAYGGGKQSESGPGKRGVSRAGGAVGPDDGVELAADAAQHSRSRLPGGAFTPRSFLTASQKGSSGPALERGSLCRPSGPDGEGRARGQARSARGEPPHPESRGKSVILTEVPGPR